MLCPHCATNLRAREDTISECPQCLRRWYILQTFEPEDPPNIPSVEERRKILQIGALQITKQDLLDGGYEHGLVEDVEQRMRQIQDGLPSALIQGVFNATLKEITAFKEGQCPKKTI